MENYQKQRIGNGSLYLPLGKKNVRVWGGPFRSRPLNMKGIKMAEEIRAACDVDIPTPDYGVPSRSMLVAGLNRTVDHILHGDPVYVGCMAGRGRTGLFLAILAKCFDIENPVEYVRKNYYSHAVETDHQYQYVNDFLVPDEIETKILVGKRLAKIRRNQEITRAPGVKSDWLDDGLNFVQDKLSALIS